MGADGPRALDRRGVAPGPRPGRACGPARGASSTPGAGPSATSPTASPTRRSAAGSRRGRRACSPTSTATSPTSRAACGSHAGGMLVTAPRPEHLDRAERARDDPRQRGPARDHHEATVHVHRLPAERTILGYLFPTWAASLAAMREIAAAEASVGHARVRPEGDAVLLRDEEGSNGARPGPVAALMTFLRPQGLRPRADVPGVHRLRGHAEPRQGRQRKLVGRIVARHGGLCIGSGPASCTTRRSSTRPTSATSCSTAAPSPTCRRPPRRGARFVHAVRDGRGARGAFARLGVRGYWMCHLSHSYHSGACLYFTFALAIRTPSRPARRVRRGEGRDPAGVRRLGPRSRTTTRWGRSTRAGSSRTSRPRRAMLRALFDGVDPGATSTRARSGPA